MGVYYRFLVKSSRSNRRIISENSGDSNKRIQIFSFILLRFLTVL